MSEETNDQNLNAANVFVDALQNVWGSTGLSNLVVTPVSEAIDNISLIIDIVQEESSETGIPTWKITTAYVGAAVASGYVVEVGYGATAASATTALLSGGPLALPASVAIFYGGSVVTFQTADKTNQVTHDALLEYLNSSDFIKAENSVGNWIGDFKDSLNEVIGKTTGWSQKPFWMNDLIKAKDATLNGVTDVEAFLKNLLDDYVDDAQTVGDYLLSSLESLYNSALIRRVDPLTLDLDGDGIELINVNNSTAFFDLDVTANADGTYTSDGVKEQVGWVKGDDGLLVLDKNGNGTVDNILELFGKTDKTGTEELREYDLNGDGKIDSSDAIFSQLKVWQDVNQNGISESNELKSLSDLNITSINVSPESLTTLNQESNGNTILSQGTYTTSDGTQRSYANLDLAVNQTNSTSYEYTDSDGNTSGDYELNLEVLNLPFIRGYGDVKALPIAACNDATLLNLLTELRDLESANYRNISSLVEQIIFQWTGASDIDSTAMRGSFSAQKLAAMEAIGGQDYYSTQTQSNDVASWQADSVNSAWTTFFNDIKEKLLIQSTFKEIFSYTVTTEIPESTETVTNEDGSTTEVTTPAYTTTETIYPIYDFATDSINFSDLTADQVFANIATKLTDGSIESTVSDATDPTVAAELNAIYTYAEKATFVKQIQGILNSIPTEINGLSTEVIASNISSINTTYLNNVVAGLSSSDFVADTQVNEANDTIIIGNQGDDILHGYKGNDTYVFNIGDGKDSIDESGRSGNFVNDEQNTDYGTDTILMGAGITKDDVYISGNASQMVIKFKSTNSDQITINSQNYTAGKVETILFSNGDIIDLTDPDLKYNFYGTNSNDTISGNSETDDIIQGEQGNDILQGANGNDTYIFNRGDGQDVIAEYGVFSVSSKYDTGSIAYGTSAAGSDANISLGTDTIQFEVGITESDLTFFVNGQDLHIGISDSPSDLIIIKDHFNGVANRIENLKFTNEAGETTILDLTTKDWLTMTLTTTGTPQDDVINASLGDDVIYSEGGNDTINAGLGNDLLNGGTGNDALNGGEGSDIYEFNLGDGEDTITDSANGDDENKIVFGIGISASNLTFARGSGTGAYQAYNHINISNDNEPELALNKFLAS